jgi:hypothetical protein
VLKVARGGRVHPSISAVPKNGEGGTAPPPLTATVAAPSLPVTTASSIVRLVTAATVPLVPPMRVREPPSALNALTGVAFVTPSWFTTVRSFGFSGSVAGFEANSCAILVMAPPPHR